MKITSVRLGRISVPLRTPFKTALRSVSSVEDVIVEIRTDCGAVGYGEAPPTGAITGDTTGAIIGAIQDHIAKTIIGRDVDELEPLLQSVQKCIVGNSSAKAAVDMALWDLYGQLYNIPVYKLLGGGRKQIVTDITISVNDPDTMVSDSLKAVENEGRRKPGAGRRPAQRRAQCRWQGHRYPHRRQSGMDAQAGREDSE